jgi:hypothetical protein
MSGNTSNTTYDFGFTFEDPSEVAVQQTVQQTVVDTSGQDEILAKLAALEAKIVNSDPSGIVAEHKALLEQEVALKLKDVESLILPLLYNLQKNPEKEYIHWPNRVEIINAQIKKITDITRYYERV